MMFRDVPIFSLALMLSICLVPAWAQPSLTPDQTKRTNKCTEKIDQLAAAYSTRDWTELARQGEQYTKVCFGAFDSAERDTNGYDAVASANLELGKFSNALVASEKCIQIFYANASCHISKVSALIGLKRTKEAKSALGVVERLIEHRIEYVSRKVATENDASTVEELNSMLNLLNALKRKLASMKAESF